MYKHILVPTDGSPLSLKAVKTAAALARTLHARVTAIHVMQPFDPPMASEGVIFRAANLIQEYERGMRKSAEKALAMVAKTVKAPCDTVAVFHNNPWEAIVDTAASKKCDVIVMASHGRGKLASLLIGSETQKVLARSKTPVLVCR